MNIKLSVLTAGILAGISATASAFTPPNPPIPDDIYKTGPAEPRLNNTNLSPAERSAFALMESVMQIAEAKIYATSCAAGTWNLEIYANGSVGNNANTTNNNTAIVTSSGGSNAPQFRLGANVKAAIVNRGQQVEVKLQTGPGLPLGIKGYLGSTPLVDYQAVHAFNNLNNMMVNAGANITIVGDNGTPDQYQGSVIKDFFRGAAHAADGSEYYNIYDWGLQSVSKLGYPVNKYWQRSKVHRDNGVNGRTVWVKDRLVGANSCRITIDTNGYNDQSPLFWQGNDAITGPGILKIEQVDPQTAVPAWTEYPFQ